MARPPVSRTVDVLLVSLAPDVREISALLASAGHRIVETIVQRRDRPDTRTFVGRGKLDELRARVDAGGIAAVVFNGELRPTMHYLLERELGVECYDRLRVLLELFAQRASSREGKLQVELALLQYEIPLLREWIHEADVGERPGFMAGGELRVDAYYETVKRRIKKIRDELEAIRRERAVRRSVRKERGYHLVALAGYANAGKSSLLNVLADERVVVDDRMFSTLATTTRSLTGTRKRILISTRTGRGLDELRNVITNAFAYPIEVHLILPQDAEAGGKLHWLYERTEVVSAVHRPDRIEVVVRCRPRDRESVERLGRVLLARTIE